MKSVAVLMFTLFTIVSCQDSFRYPPTGEPCVLAQFSASMQLNFTYNNQTETAEASLPPAKNVKVDGSCAGNQSSATLSLAFDNFTLIFNIFDKNSTVSADIQLVLENPSATFPGVNYSTAFALNGDGEEFPDLGRKNQSYLCKAPEDVSLAGNDSQATGSAIITLSDLRIQAFGVENGTFSEADECSADKSSTTASTTPSTTVMTTTLPAPTGVGNYTLTDSSGNACLRMEANITISVTYTDKQGKLMNRTVMVPDDTKPNGTCGATEITLDLPVKDEAEMVTNGTLSFVFVKMQDFSFIKSWSFDLSFKDSNDTVSDSNENANDVLALSDKFYSCKEELFTMEMDEVALRDLKVQAFDLPTGDFSSNGLDCNAAPPKEPTSGNYTVMDGNVTCISMSAKISLQVNYITTENKNDTKTVNFEAIEPAEGQCSGNSSDEYIQVKYKKDKFMVVFQFVRDGKVAENLGAETFQFYVQNVSVTYTLDPVIFANAKNSEESYTFEMTNQKLYETSSDKYFKCATETNTEINPSVHLITRDLRLVAFNTDPKTPNLYGDNVNECAGDTETNSVVPIAVGAALAGLVVIVLIAYLIGRRRNKKGYESV